MLRSSGSSSSSSSSSKASLDETAARVSAFLAELKASSSSRNLVRGRDLHRAVLQTGHDSDACVASALINMYGKCGSMRDARAVFDKLHRPDVVSWTALILGYADNGEGALALVLFDRMRQEGCEPNARTFLAALRACVDIAASDRGIVHRGKLLQILASRDGFDSNLFVESTLLDMYAKCGSMHEALAVFERMRCRDAVSWNALISGYADNGKGAVALDLFKRMRRESCAPDARTYVAALKACTELTEGEMGEQLVPGKALHLLALRDSYCSDRYVKCTLVNMYSTFGSMDNALTVFETLQSRDVVTWTALILGYAENGEASLALDHFARMRGEECTADTRTFVAAIKACTGLGSGSRVGKALHTLATKCGCYSDLYVESTLLDLYAKCRVMDEARAVFENMRCRDTAAWNAVILGYAENGEGSIGLDLFARMVDEGYTPNSRTFVSLFKACTALGAKEKENDRLEKATSIEMGKELHLLASKCGCDLDVFVGNTLVDMYAKCGSMKYAYAVFDSLQHRDNVSWNALVLGYADNGDGSMALELFARMRREGCRPDAFTFAAVLKACASLGALEYGRRIYAEICRSGFQSDAVLATCLVDFYAKCASLVEAKQMFDLHATRESVSWNALMAGYSRHGDAEGAFELFDSMRESGLRGDQVTFLCLLTACSHAGLIQKGKECFESMSTKYGVEPSVEHYTCMVDMLGRANRLEDAMALLRSICPNIVICTTVLGACRKWKNVGLGRLAFEASVSLDDKLPAVYVLMANIYGSKGMWKEQASVQATRKKLKVWKTPGQSWWTNKAGVVHSFMAGDRSHLQIREMDEKLKNIVSKMKARGYVADLSSVTSDISDGDKENALCGHSERLAIACALINTEEGEAIRIIKNLRICDDCHTVTALISKLEARTILCRDASRFHVFKDGKCSCGDFW